MITGCGNYFSSLQRQRGGRVEPPPEFENRGGKEDGNGDELEGSDLVFNI